MEGHDLWLLTSSATFAQRPGPRGVTGASGRGAGSAQADQAHADPRRGTARRIRAHRVAARLAQMAQMLSLRSML